VLPRQPALRAALLKRAIVAAQTFALGLAAAGCGPWYTTIPTYWAPVAWSGSEATEAPLPPAARPRPTPRAAAAGDYEVPEDTPAQCSAIYLVSKEKNLYAYKPHEGSFELRGSLGCPDVAFARPFSMAVARDGTARVLYDSGRIFSVRVDDAACTPTAYRTQSHHFQLFGMAYAGAEDGDETLYVAEINQPLSWGLARIEGEALTLTAIGRFASPPGGLVELTPGRDGALHGYFINSDGSGGTLVRIDTATAALTEVVRLPIGANTNWLAFAHFNDYFFVFSQQGLGSVVTRYDPRAKATEVVDTLDQRIVGAGVSNCVPARAPSSSGGPSSSEHSPK
jgi:hypothetical protein